MKCGPLGTSGKIKEYRETSGVMGKHAERVDLSHCCGDSGGRHREKHGAGIVEGVVECGLICTSG